MFWNIVAAIVGIAVGVLIGYMVRKNIAEAKVKTAEDAAVSILINAKKEAEAKKKEALLEVKDEVYKLRTETENDFKERRSELQRLERRAIQKEETLDKKLDSFEKKEENLAKKEQEIEKKRLEAEELHNARFKELERIAGLTSQEAKELLLQTVEDEVKYESAIMIRDIENQAREEGDRRAKEIVAEAIQRVAADHVAETTVSVVSIPNEDMKGRIIGREGRNIRTLETMTGIDLIIDDTPEAVILSGFDPVRREIARIALEKLILDGRIHPARIEELVEKAKKEVDQRIWEAGEQATFDAGVHGLHKEEIKLIGRLLFRTSYGQNVLKHSVEVAHLAGLMAAEMGADIVLAKRGGLLHDLGKAADHEIEGSHVTIGMDFAKKYHENAQVIHCIAAHHGDVEVSSIEAALVQAADAISAARPGARRETLEYYIKRLQKLEEIANDFDGVERSFAIQAGREIRVIVKPEKVDDVTAVRFAREIAKRIEAELEYPGQIKVVLVRETRVVDYAK